MMNELIRMVEAVLFASQKPISVEGLMGFLPDGIDDGDVRKILAVMQDDYANKGFTLVQHGGEWMFRTHPDMADMLEPMRVEQRPLSRAAQETLAVIAYHQPLTRAEIETIRGVASGKGTLDILVEAGWVKPGRRRDTPGRPLTWMTTIQFLHDFSLESIKDLPGLDELEAAGLLDRRPSIETLKMPHTGELFDEEEEGITDPERTKEEENA